MFPPLTVLCQLWVAAAPYFPAMPLPDVGTVAADAAGGPVILIVVDAMRPDHLTPYGSGRDTSPNLMALARDGVTLANYYVNGNWTKPSTATLLTGLPPAVHGVEHEQDRLAEGFVTVAELLGRRGVPTGAVVGNGNAGSAFGLARGFDFYADTVAHWRGLPSADQVVSLAVPFVRQHRDDNFFLLLFMVDPHDPYHAPPPYDGRFVADAAVPLVTSPRWEGRHYTAAQVRRMEATYDGAIAYTDAAIGRFVGELKALGVYERATVMVTADHGEAFGEHGEFLHAHHLYDEIIRAPFIVRTPRMGRRGGRHEGTFQGLDVLPTLAAAFGAPRPEGLEGLDILAALGRPAAAQGARPVSCAFNNFGIRRRALVQGGRKLIHEAPADAAAFARSVGSRALLPSVRFDRERWQAFDLTADPFERHDLATPARLRQAPWQQMVRALRRARRDAAAQPAAPVAGNLDAETYEDLRSLGYVQ